MLGTEGLLKLTMDLEGNYHLSTGERVQPVPIGDPVGVEEKVGTILREGCYDIVDKLEKDQIPKDAIAYCSINAGISSGDLLEPSLSDTMRYEIQFFKRLLPE